MDKRRWLAAAGFATLNVALFFVALRDMAFVFLVGAPWLIPVLWALCVVTGHWCLVAVDLGQKASGDLPRLIVRGSIAGIAVGGVMGGLVLVPDWALVGSGAALGAFAGMFAGGACAIVDWLVLVIVRGLLPARVTLAK